MSVQIRPQTEAGLYSPKEGKCGQISAGRAEDLNEPFKTQLQSALAERDQMWRRHEKEQISYIQSQNSILLSRLHTEIERLQNANRDLERRLYVSTDPEDSFDNLSAALKSTQNQNEKLRKDLNSSESRNRRMAETLEQSAKLYKDQVTEHVSSQSVGSIFQENRIRQLSNELDHRTLTITQLSAQLRNFKLREAMAQAQQRRRASFVDSKAESTGFRLFGPKAPPPTNRRLPFVDGDSGGVENSIEKPSLKRSTSAGIPPTKPHLINALRNAHEFTENE